MLFSLYSYWLVDSWVVGFMLCQLFNAEVSFFMQAIIWFQVTNGNDLRMLIIIHKIIIG